MARARELATDSERAGGGIRGAGPRRQVRAVQAGFRGEDRNLAVPAVDLHVRQSRALSGLMVRMRRVALHASEMTTRAAS